MLIEGEDIVGCERNLKNGYVDGDVSKLEEVFGDILNVWDYFVGLM